MFRPVVDAMLLSLLFCVHVSGLVSFYVMHCAVIQLSHLRTVNLNLNLKKGWHIAVLLSFILHNIHIFYWHALISHPHVSKFKWVNN